MAYSGTAPKTSPSGRSPAWTRPWPRVTGLRGDRGLALLQATALDLPRHPPGDREGDLPPDKAMTILSGVEPPTPIEAANISIMRLKGTDRGCTDRGCTDTEHPKPVSSYEVQPDMRE